MGQKITEIDSINVIRPACRTVGGLQQPSSGSANLDVLAPDSTSLREEFEHWRLQEDHFGWAASSDILHRLAARERYRRGSPHSKKRARLGDRARWQKTQGTL